MARTIGTPTRGILSQDAIDTRDRPEPELARELERPGQIGDRVTQRSEFNAYLGKGLKWYTNPQSSGIGYDSATDAINAQRMAAIVNDDDITVSKEMVDIINDASTKLVDGQFTRIIPTGREAIRRSGQFARSSLLLGIDPGARSQEPGARKRRKKSKYSKELSKQLKQLVKKHPRTPVIKLMKRAHRATKKALK